MGIGNAEIFKDALDGAILAEWTMQRVEGDIGPELGEHRPDVAPDIDARDLVAFLLQFIGTSLSGGQRHGPLGRKTTQQDGHMLAFHSPASPLRRTKNQDFPQH